MWTNCISFWDDLVDPMKVTFDGDNKLIKVNPQYSNNIRVKQDIYSASKRWLQRRRNFTYAQPMRGIGGDQLTGGLYAGDIYFLTNGWQIQIDHAVQITGTVYQDSAYNYLSVYVVLSGGGVIATVSSQAYAYSSSGVTVPSASQVASAVWNSVTSELTGVGTIGAQIVATDNLVTNVKVNTDNILALSA